MSDFYKKETYNDVLIKIFDEKGNYSVTSKNDPEPDVFTGPSFHGQANKQDSTWGWEKISKAEAERILGYDPTD